WGEEAAEERGELGGGQLARRCGRVADVAVRQEGARGGEDDARERARGARGERHDAARAGGERDLEQPAEVAEVARVGDELRQVGLAARRDEARRAIGELDRADGEPSRHRSRLSPGVRAVKRAGWTKLPPTP